MFSIMHTTIGHDGWRGRVEKRGDAEMWKPWKGKDGDKYKETGSGRAWAKRES